MMLVLSAKLSKLMVAARVYCEARPSVVARARDAKSGRANVWVKAIFGSDKMRATAAFGH